MPRRLPSKPIAAKDNIGHRQDSALAAETGN